MIDKPMQNESAVWSMNRALEYIKEHLEEELSLEEISQVALLSKFHFHRIFKMVTSESLTQFIQRLRIEKAANIIYGESQLSLTEIALLCGFSSSGYFSRVFKEHYGISASSFRQFSMLEKQQFIKNNIRGLMPLSSFPQLEDKVEVEIEEIHEMNLAYIRKFYFDLQEEPAIIHRMFEYITAWGHEKRLMGEGTKVLGIIYDNPYLTPLSNYQYDACITVNSSITEEGLVGIKTIPRGRYAVLKLRKVNKDKLERSIFTFLTSWFPPSGYYIDNRPILEFYYGPNSGDSFTMDFCVPISIKN